MALAVSPLSGESASFESTPLVRLSAGAQGRVLALHVPASDAAALEAMGLVVGAQVRVCRVGQPTIVAVLSGDPASGCACGGSRLGLAHDLAAQISVQPLASCAGGGLSC